MSTIIRTRSPFFIRTPQVTDVTLAYFQLNLTIWKGASGSITQCNDVYEQYTFTKKPLPSEGSVTFEVSEIVHNHLEQSFNGTYTTSAINQSLWVSLSTSARTSEGAIIGTATSNTYLAQEGFNRFKEGVNYTTEPSVMITGNYVQYSQGTTLYIPLNNETVGSLKMYFSNGTTQNDDFADNGQSTQKIKYASYATSTNVPTKVEAYSGTGSTGSLLKTITCEAVEECKYGINKITFLNRWGALQELFFFKKSISSMDATRETFNRSIFQARVVQITDAGDGTCADNITYNQMNVNEHVKKTFNSQAIEKIALNSGFLNDDMNTSFQELMLSEYIWLTGSDGVINPVNLVDSSFTNKTSVNDRLVSYQMTFEISAPYINQIR